jgi:hypothetical protein
MPARLAKPEDAAYIDERLRSRKQVWASEAIAQALVSDRYIMVVDPPLGFFWATLDETDKTLVHAGITFSNGTDAQIKGLYKAALLRAKVIWPQAKTLRALIDPAACSADAYRGATQLVGMPAVGQVERWQVREIKWANLLAAVGVK